MKTYTLHRFELLSLFKFGFFNGLLTAFFPVALTVWASWRAIVGTVAWLTSLTYEIPLGITTWEINGVELLHAQKLLETLQTLADWGWIYVSLLTVALSVGVGLFSGWVVFTSGIIFNVLATLSGGLRMTFTEENRGVSPPPRIEYASSSSPQRPGARLDVTGPVTRTFLLTGQITMIGSASTCEVQLPGLGAQHARITLEEGRYLLHDLGQGQIRVQGYPMQGVRMLKEGFVLQIGDYRMTFREG